MGKISESYKKELLAITSNLNDPLENCYSILELKRNVIEKINELLSNGKAGVNFKTRRNIESLIDFLHQDIQNHLWRCFLDIQWKNNVITETQNKLRSIVSERDLNEKIKRLKILRDDLQININIYNSMLDFKQASVSMGFQAERTLYLNKKLNLEFLIFSKDYVLEQLSLLDLHELQLRLDKIEAMEYRDLDKQLQLLYRLEDDLRLAMASIRKMNHSRGTIKPYQEFCRHVKLRCKLILKLIKMHKQLRDPMLSILHKQSLEKQNKFFEKIKKQIRTNVRKEENPIILNFYRANDAILTRLMHASDRKIFYRDFSSKMPNELKRKIQFLMDKWDDFLLKYPEELNARGELIKEMQITLKNIKQSITPQMVGNSQEIILRMNFDFEKMRIKLKDIHAALEVDRRYHQQLENEAALIPKIWNSKEIEDFLKELGESDPLEIEKLEESLLGETLHDLDWCHRPFGKLRLKHYVDQWIEDEKNLPFFTWLQTQSGVGGNDLDGLSIFYERKKSFLENKKIHLFDLKNKKVYLANQSLRFKPHSNWQLVEDELLKALTWKNTLSEISFVVNDQGEHLLSGSDVILRSNDLIFESSGIISRWMGSFGIFNGQIRWISNKNMHGVLTPLEEMHYLQFLKERYQFDLNQVGLKLFVQYHAEHDHQLVAESCFYFDNAQDVLKIFESQDFEGSVSERKPIHALIEHFNAASKHIEVSTKYYPTAAYLRLMEKFQSNAEIGQ